MSAICFKTFNIIRNTAHFAYNAAVFYLSFILRTYKDDFMQNRCYIDWTTVIKVNVRLDQNQKSNRSWGRQATGHNPQNLPFHATYWLFIFRSHEPHFLDVKWGSWGRRSQSINNKHFRVPLNLKRSKHFRICSNLGMI